MELKDFYPQISEKKIPLVLLGVSSRIYLAWKEAGIINTVIAESNSHIERKTKRKWVHLDVFNALWLLIVKEMRKINIDFETIKEIKDKMFAMSVIEKKIEQISNDEFVSILLDYYPAETIEEFGDNLNKQYFIDTIKDNLAEETSLYLSELSGLLFSALVLKRSPSIMIIQETDKSNFSFATIKNNPTSSNEKEELYDFYSKTCSSNTFINIPIVPILVKLFENEKMESYLSNFGLFSIEESRILNKFRNNECKEITIIKHESGNVCINTTNEKNIKDEEAKKLRTILGLKEYSRAEVIFRNGKHMVVKNSIKEIIEKK
jgi:hypothetical protein